MAGLCAIRRDLADVFTVFSIVTQMALCGILPHTIGKGILQPNTPGLFEMLREVSLSLFHPWFVQLGNKEYCRMSLPGLL